MGLNPRFLGTGIVTFILGAMTILCALCVLERPAMGQSNVTTQPAGGQPLNITADRIDHLQEFDIYEAEGSVVVTQGRLAINRRSCHDPHTSRQSDSRGTCQTESIHPQTRPLNDWNSTSIPRPASWSTGRSSPNRVIRS